MRTKAAASSSRAQLSLSFPLFLFFLKSRRRKKAAAAPPPRPLPQQSWPRNVNYFQTTENYDCCSSDVCSVRPASPARRRARRDICFQHSLVLSLARRGRSLHNVSSSLTVLPLRGRGRERGGAALSLGDKCKFVECEQKKASGKYNARKPSIIAYCLSGALFSPASERPSVVVRTPKRKVVFQPISQKER